MYCDKTESAANDLVCQTIELLIEKGYHSLIPDLTDIFKHNMRLGRVTNYLNQSPYHDLNSYLDRLVATLQTKADYVAALQNGDIELQIAFWESLVNRAYRWLIHRGASTRQAHDNANDAAQDTWQKVVSGKARFPFDTSFEAWTATILYNRLKKAYTRRQDVLDQDETISIDSKPAVWHDRIHDPAAPQPHNDYSRSRLIGQAMEQLPGGQQQAVALFYLQGLSAEKAAKIAKCSPGAFNSRCHRARQRMAEFFSSLDLDLSDFLPLQET